MNKEMAFYSKYTNYHERFSRLSGYMQFPVISKSDVKGVLNDEEYKHFADKMKDYENKGLLTEKEDSFVLTQDGVFWGNNISSDIIVYVMEQLYKN